MIVDQKAKCMARVIQITDQLTSLLSDPIYARFFRSPSEVNSSCPKYNEEKHVNGVKMDCFNDEEITGESLVFVVDHQMSLCYGTIANRHGEDTMLVENIAYG